MNFFSADGRQATSADLRASSPRSAGRRLRAVGSPVVAVGAAALLATSIAGAAEASNSGENDSTETRHAASASVEGAPSVAGPNPDANRQGTKDKFYAGQLMTFKRNGVEYACTTGFAWNDRRQMLSAAHCGNVDDNRFRVGPEGSAWGHVLSNSYFRPSSKLDFMEMDTHHDAEPHLFTGGNTSNYMEPIVRTSKLVKDDTVCNNGANSGEHCSLNVLRKQDYNFGKDAHWCNLDDPEYRCVGWFAHRSQSDGEAMANAGGDSGGPVILEEGAGGKAAVGIVSGGWGKKLSQNYCEANTYTSTDECWDGLIFVDILDVEKTTGGHITLAKGSSSSDRSSQAPTDPEQETMEHSLAPGGTGVPRETFEQAWKEASAFGQDVLFDHRYDTETGTLIISRTEASPADVEWKRIAAAYGLTVKLETSKWTMDQADERIAELSKNYGRWADEEGFNVSALGYSPYGVEVGVREGLDKARSYFADVDDIISVEHLDVWSGGLH